MRQFSRPIQLQKGEQIENFCCGQPVIDRWAYQYAHSARKRGTAVVYVSRCEDSIAGFYTLSTHSVTRSDVSSGWFSRNAPNQIPAILLGMLGVDERFKGCGLGAQLLRDAILKSLKIAELAGARALIVDPVDDNAAEFYRHFGFSDLPGTERMALKLQ